MQISDDRRAPALVLVIAALATTLTLALTMTRAGNSSTAAGTPPTIKSPDPAAATMPSPAGPHDWLLFQQSGKGRVEVALVRPDGTDLHNPVAGVGGTGDQSNPDWAPDGRRLVFAMSDGERDDLWVADDDGAHARMLLDCRGACRWLDDPDWSPDGRRVVYSRTRLGPRGTGVSTMESVDVRSGRVRVLVGSWSREFTAGARWSPDGTRVVFERVHKVDAGLEADIDGVTLTVVHLDRAGHPLEALTDPQLYAATADWSPDGRRIVYSALARPDSAAPDLFLISSSGGPPARVTHLSEDGGYANEPAWELESAGLVFSGRLDSSLGEPLLLVVGADGTGLGSAFGDELIHGRHPRVQPLSG